MRGLAASGHDRAEAILQHAFQEIHHTAHETRKSAAIRTLVDGATLTMPPGRTTDQRARALWRLIQDEISHVEFRDERAALRAALHSDPTNRKSSIDKRLTFARDRGDFGIQPSGGQHGYDALRRWWGAGVRLLAHAVDERLDYLRDHPAEWQQYFADTVETTYRRPPKSAQPVFAELFVTTVFMRGRLVHRRITERLVTAKKDQVEFYAARALPEVNDASASVPVRALWGCRAERIPSQPGEPILTKLWFPRPLRRGEMHYFSSEATAGAVETPRRAINVEIDHHGIAPGRRSKTMPVSGLVIRVRFDEKELPEAVWWYADVAERERYRRPEDAESERWIKVSPHGDAEHLFAAPCQPLANYGVSIAWRDG